MDPDRVLLGNPSVPYLVKYSIELTFGVTLQYFADKGDSGA